MMQTETAARYLAEGRDALVRAVDRLAEAELRFTPGPDRWSIAGVVEHLARVEEFFVQRIAPRMADLPASSSGDQFLAGREPTATFVRSTPGLLERALEHPALGPMNVYQWALFIAAHTERHLRQIEGITSDARLPCATCS
jgi:hypothetical protein